MNGWLHQFDLSAFINALASGLDQRPMKSGVAQISFPTFFLINANPPTRT
jgi:hypothetical protein